uniref:NADH-ubiquinone oxidoreductase chain 2 n=1 Tax=Bathysciadiidae sp. MNHN-IM-2013-40843 TaxID=2496596 RepID=A0A6B7FQI0_9GAST|nr:NADH dehydrogenase subunit 2 [Bathysciadiidae sp. MNHN-IM-2013-40843]
MIFGTLISISTSYWLIMWLGMEINLIAFIPLMASQGKPVESEAAIKYFIFQALGSSLFILGSIMAFNSNPSWNFPMTPNLLWATFILLGLSIKLGSFPLHFWFPKVASSLTWEANMLLFIWQKISPLFSMVSLTPLLNPLSSLILLTIAMLSSMVGALSGLNQTQIRSLLAYSSISHLGWMMVACYMSLSSFKIYFFSYASISLMIILMAKEMEIHSTSQAASIFFSHKLQPLMMISFLSLAGLPPLLGFAPKWVVISLLASKQEFFFLFLLLLSSVISLYYYLKFSMSFFFSSLNPMKSPLSSMTFFAFSSFLKASCFTLNCGGGLLLMNVVILFNLYALNILN